MERKREKADYVRFVIPDGTLEKADNRLASEVVEDTLRAVHVAGDMVLVGLKECREALKTSPFIPDVNDFGTKVWLTTGFGDLRPEQKAGIAYEFGRIWKLMERRADYQRRWAQNPALVKQNIFQNIISDLGPSFPLDLSEISIKWSLFSMIIAAKEKTFMGLRRAFAPQLKGKTTGFTTGRFRGPMGLVPVVLDRNDVMRVSIWHEDIHALQAARREMVTPFDLQLELENERLLRAVYDEENQRGNLQVSLGFLERVCEQTRRDVDIELRAYLWDGEFPHVRALDSEEMGPIHLAFLAVFNVAYAPTSSLTDKQKVETCFSAIFQTARIDHYRQLLYAYARQAFKNYQGKSNPWHWVASRLTVLPVGSSPALVRAVLLGRDRGLEERPELNAVSPLAAALLIHARRTVNPGSYGEGEEVPRERTKAFWEFLEKMFNERQLFANVCDAHGIEKKRLLALKKEVIYYARKSVARGMRGQTKRRLKKTLLI